MPSNSESESEGEIKETQEQNVTAPQPMDVAQSIEAIDQEMQQKLLDLHDQMEESGLHGAVNLLKKLFDTKSGDDIPDKKKLKSKIHTGTNRPKNTNDNRSNHKNKTLSNPDDNMSVVMIY